MSSLVMVTVDRRAFRLGNLTLPGVFGKNGDVGISGTLAILPSDGQSRNWPPLTAALPDYFRLADDPPRITLALVNNLTWALAAEAAH